MGANSRKLTSTAGQVQASCYSCHLEGAINESLHLIKAMQAEAVISFSDWSDMHGYPIQHLDLCVGPQTSDMTSEESLSLTTGSPHDNTVPETDTILATYV